MLAGFCWKRFPCFLCTFGPVISKRGGLSLPSFQFTGLCAISVAIVVDYVIPFSDSIDTAIRYSVS